MTYNKPESERRVKRIGLVIFRFQKNSGDKHRSVSYGAWVMSR